MTLRLVIENVIAWHLFFGNTEKENAYFSLVVLAYKHFDFYIKMFIKMRARRFMSFLLARRPNKYHIYFSPPNNKNQTPRFRHD